MSAEPGTGAVSGAGGSLRRAVLDFGPPLLLGLAPLVVLPFPGESENLTKSAVLQAGIALLALVWIVGRASAPGRRTPLELPIVLFYLACVLSLLQAVNVYEALPALLHWGAGVILFLLLSRTLRGAGAVTRFFVAAALGAGAVALIGIAQQRLGLDWIPQSAPPASTFVNRNMAAQFVAICCPLTLGLMVMARSSRVRVLAMACLLLSAVYLAYANSRAAALAVLFVFAGAAIGLRSGRPGAERAAGRRESLSVIVSLLAIVCLVGLAGTWGAGSGALRLTFWKNTLAMVRDQPLGVGLGNFELQYPRYHRAVEVDWTFDEEHQLERAHNDHLQILAETGFAGLAAWIWIFAAAFGAFRRCRRQPEERISRQALFVGLGVVSFLVVACFSFPMERAMPPIWLFALLGMLGALDAGGPPAAARTPLPPALRWVGAVLLAGFLATSVSFARRQILSGVHHAKGIRWSSAGEPARAVAELEIARRLTPHDTDVLLRLAAARISLDDCNRALELFPEVLRLHPYKVNAIANAGYCHLQREDYIEAESRFRELVELLPDSPEARMNLGSALFSQGRVDAAVEAYREAVALAETKSFLPGARTRTRFVQPRLLLANAYVAQGELRPAIEQYERILELDPGLQDVRKVLEELQRTAGATAENP